jgi:hypothetical protein
VRVRPKMVMRGLITLEVGGHPNLGVYMGESGSLGSC